MQYWMKRPVATMHFRQLRQFRSGSGIPVQRGGRRFTKGDAIGHRKAPELQELMGPGDLRNARRRRVSPLKCGTGLVQALHQKVARGAHAEKFGATHPEGSLGYADLCAKPRHAGPVISKCVQRFLETSHDGCVMPSRLLDFVRVVLPCEAMNDGVQHVLFQRSRDLGEFGDFPSGFDEMAGLPEQTLKPHYFRSRRMNYAACAG